MARRKTSDFTQSQMLYDIDFDQQLIEQSIVAQYGILPYTQSCLPYKEWAALVGGLMPDSLLGRVIAIRREKDRKIIDQMTPEEKEIRRQWQTFLHRQPKPKVENTLAIKQQMQELQQAFRQMYQVRG